MDALIQLPSERFLLDLILKGALLMLLAFAFTFALQRASAALRHAVWSLALGGLLLLPFCSAVLPTWQVALLPDFLPTEAVQPPASEPEHAESRFAAGGAYEQEPPGAAENHARTEPLGAGALPAGPIVGTPGDSAGDAWSWTSLALLLWIGGAIVLFIRMAVVLRKLSLVRRSAIPVTDRVWLERAEILPEVLDIRRPVLLLQHDEIVVPMTYGVRRPVILLPVHADDWSEDQKHATLMHELLHVQRFDHFVHVLALTARALHWFNPLTWAAARRLVVERERACDDGVLSMGVASTSYADHLLGMARHVLSGKEASAAAVAMARPTELRSRIVAILNPGQPRRALTPLRAAGMAACALILVVLVAAVQPAGSLNDSGDSSRLAQQLNAHEADAGGMSTTGHPASARGIDLSPTESTGRGTREQTMASIDDIVAGWISEDVDADENVDGRNSGKMKRKDWPSADTTDFETQRRAIHAISELPRNRSIPLLREIAETHPNEELRAEAVFWLGEVGDGSTAELLESFARNDASEEVQKKAIFALSELDDELGVPHLLNLARSQLSEELRADVVFWLGEAGGAGVADALESFARNDASEEVQKKAIFALAEMDDDEAVARLTNLARTHPSSEMQAEAVFWLGEHGGRGTADLLADFARTGATREIQKKAVFALSEIHDNEGVPHLIGLAKSHPDPEVRSEAIFWLGETGDPRAADVLMEIVNER